jgi:hypothetical protein
MASAIFGVRTASIFSPTLEELRVSFFYSEARHNAIGYFRSAIWRPDLTIRQAWYKKLTKKAAAV